MSDHYDRYNGMENLLGTNLAEVGTDCISRQAVLDIAFKYCPDDDGVCSEAGSDLRNMLDEIENLPTAEPEPHEIGYDDCANALLKMWMDNVLTDGEYYRIANKLNVKWGKTELPERTCVNCGRTVNNGGWYADGGTRCPIEEHYALPKDGYCHLWEKRNVTDDNYPERRTDE